MKKPNKFISPFPESKFVYESNLPPAVFAQRLNWYVQKPRTFKFLHSGPNKIYEGTVTASRIRIQRYAYRDNDNPEVFGSIRETDTGCILHMEVSAPIKIALLMTALFLATIGLSGYTIYLSGIREDFPFEPFIPAVVLGVFLYLVRIYSQSIVTYEKKSLLHLFKKIDSALVQ